MPGGFLTKLFLASTGLLGAGFVLLSETSYNSILYLLPGLLATALTAAVLAKKILFQSSRALIGQSRKAKKYISRVDDSRKRKILKSIFEELDKEESEAEQTEEEEEDLQKKERETDQNQENEPPEEVEQEIKLEIEELEDIERKIEEIESEFEQTQEEIRQLEQEIEREEKAEEEQLEELSNEVEGLLEDFRETEKELIDEKSKMDNRQISNKTGLEGEKLYEEIAKRHRRVESRIADDIENKLRGFKGGRPGFHRNGTD